MYFELFNTAGVAVLLPLNGKLLQASGHAVDVLTGASLEPRIDEARVREVPWAATHTIGDPEIVTLQVQRLNGLAQLMARRSQVAALARTCAEILGGNDERVFRPQDIPGVVERLVRHVEEHWLRPDTTTAQMRGDVEGFQHVCKDLEALLPTGMQPIFRTAIDEVVIAWQERIRQTR